MENENLMPTPEQPEQLPVEQPEQPVQPPVEQPVQPPVPEQYQPPQYQPPQYRPPVRQKKSVWKVLLPVAAGLLVLALLIGAYFLFLRGKPVKELTLSETAVCLKPQDVYELYFTYAPEDADAFDYRWTSSDTSVAVVKNGSVTAVGEGDCTVTLATDNGLSAVCSVTVRKSGTTAAVVGTWRFDGAYIDDVYHYADDAQATLSVYADGSGELTLNGRTLTLTWSFAGRTDRDERYDVRMEDGTSCQFWYVTDPEDQDYGVLALYGDEKNIIYFIK